MGKSQDIERAGELQQRVLDLVYKRIPDTEFSHAYNSLGILKRRRDLVRNAAGPIGAYVKAFWNREVLPQVREVGKNGVQIPYSVMHAALPITSVTEFPRPEEPGRPVIGFSDNEQLSLGDLRKITFLPPGEGGYLIGFYSHDRYYSYPQNTLIERLQEINRNPEDENQPPVSVQFKDFEQLKGVFENFGSLVSLSRFPHDFMAATVQLNINRKVDKVLGDIKTDEKDKLSPYFKNSREQIKIFEGVRTSLTAPVDEEDIDVVNDIVSPISRLIGIRFVEHDYHFSSDQESDKNTISVETSGSPSVVRMNYGVLTSIVYNLAKNSVKAHDASMREKAGEATPERFPFNIRYQIARRGKTPREPGDALTGYGIGFRVGVSKDHIEVTVADSGTGLNTDEIMQQAAEIVQSTPEPVHHLAAAFIDKDTIRVLRDWPDDDFTVRGLELGKVWDLVGLPRLSGFAPGNYASSGLGLWGIGHLISAKGGSLLVTNRYGKGASFKVRIPISASTDLQKAI